VYSIDFHVHSNYSADSIMKVEKMIKIARKIGLSGIAITDHNTVIGGLKGAKLNRHQDFHVVCGSEIDSEEGHIIGLFLNEEIQTNHAFEIVDEIKEQGGISVLAHPFKHKEVINKELLSRIDCIEVFNSRLSQHKNLRAHLLTKELNCPVLAGSDAHFYCEIGNSMVMIDEDISDTEELKKAILNRNVKICGKLTPFPSNAFSRFALVFRTHVSGRLVTKLL